MLSDTSSEFSGNVSPISSTKQKTRLSHQSPNSDSGESNTFLYVSLCTFLKASPSSLSGTIVREFTNAEVQAATSSLANVVGKGGFGKVYKGTYQGSDVAVKVFEVSMLYR